MVKLVKRDFFMLCFFLVMADAGALISKSKGKEWLKGTVREHRQKQLGQSLKNKLKGF